MASEALLAQKYGPFDESAPYCDGGLECSEAELQMKVNDGLNKYLPVKTQWVLTILLYFGMTFYLYFNFFEPFEKGSLPYKLCVFSPLIMILCLALPIGVGMVSFFDPKPTVMIILSVIMLFVAAAYDYHIAYLSAFLGGRIVSYFFECIWRGGSNNETLELVFTAGFAYPMVFANVNMLFAALHRHGIISEKWRWGFIPFWMGFIWATYAFIDAAVRPQPVKAFSTYKLNKAQYCRLCTLRYILNPIAIIGVCRPLEMMLSK